MTRVYVSIVIDEVIADMKSIIKKLESIPKHVIAAADLEADEQTIHLEGD